MGRSELKMTVTGSRSSHNSAQDIKDRGLWLLFLGEVKEIMEDNKFDSLKLEFPSDIEIW